MLTVTSVSVLSISTKLENFSNRLAPLSRYKVEPFFNFSSPILLKVNSSGESVKWLQFELREAGYDKSFTYNGKKYSAVVIDGKFGSTTKAAVMAFQQSSKIQVDGVVGKDTRTKLIAN